jgi:hypothetical protein
MVKEWVMTKQALKQIKKVSAAKKADVKTRGRTNKAPESVQAETEQQMARREMIAREAYLLAAHRNFQGGDPVNDWLEAEAKIDRGMTA